MKKLLDKPGVGGQLLLKMVKVIDSLFLGESSDVRLSAMSEKLKKKASGHKKW